MSDTICSYVICRKHPFHGAWLEEGHCARVTCFEPSHFVDKDGIEEVHCGAAHYCKNCEKCVMVVSIYEIASRGISGMSAAANRAHNEVHLPAVESGKAWQEAQEQEAPTDERSDPPAGED